MTRSAMCFATLLAGGAIAQQDSTFLLQSSASTFGEGTLVAESEERFSFVEGSFGPLPDSAPAWCKNETQLTWVQRKERMQQHQTLEWAKKMVKQMFEQNETVPG